MNRKICFVSLESISLLTLDENLKYAGGSELKQVLIGRELTKHGYDVYFITYDENNEKKIVDGITLIQSFSQYKKLSNIKKMLMIWKSLKEANADIYFQGSGPAGIIPLFCILYRKKYVKWASSDSDVLLNRIHGSHILISKIIAYFDIKFTHTIIVQNKFQKEIIEKKFKKKCILIKNPMIISDNNNFKNKENRNIVLWVGIIRAVKQPNIFLKIVKSLPEFRFKMIGGELKEEKELYDKIKREAMTLPNLEFLGFVPYHKIQKYYEEASILINTSWIEGFPNTFLEAWMNCIPVISLNVDPDEVICNQKLGIHSKTFEQLIFDVNRLLKNDELRNEMGMNARKYVEENHDINKITDQIEKLISSFEK